MTKLDQSIAKGFRELRARLERELAEHREAVADRERRLEVLERAEELLTGTEPTSGRRAVRGPRRKAKRQGRPGASRPAARRELVAARVAARKPKPSPSVAGCARAAQGGCGGSLARHECDSPGCSWSLSLCEAHNRGKARGGMIGGHRRGHARARTRSDDEAEPEED